MAKRAAENYRKAKAWRLKQERCAKQFQALYRGRHGRIFAAEARLFQLKTKSAITVQALYRSFMARERAFDMKCRARELKTSWSDVKERYEKSNASNRDAPLLIEYGIWLLACKHNFVAAKEAFNSALTVDPASPRAHYGLAIAKFMSDDPNSTLRELHSLANEGRRLDDPVFPSGMAILVRSTLYDFEFSMQYAMKHSIFEYRDLEERASVESQQNGYDQSQFHIEKAQAVTTNDLETAAKRMAISLCSYAAVQQFGYKDYEEALKYYLRALKVSYCETILSHYYGKFLGDMETRFPLSSDDFRVTFSKSMQVRFSQRRRCSQIDG